MKFKTTQEDFDAMAKTDCLIIGFYDFPFPDYVSMLQATGTDSGAYQDLALAFVKRDGAPKRALDVLSDFYHEGRPAPARPFNNSDFLWPVVAYLTTYLRKRDLAVDYVNLPHFEKDKLREKLKQGAKTVAITTTLYVSPHPILELVEMIREHDSEVKIIVGGPYISNQTHGMDGEDFRGLLEYLGGDIYVLCQDGEATLEAVLRAMKENRPLDTVPNLAFRNAQGGFTFTPTAPESNALGENVIDYAPLKQDVGEFLSIRTAKSCPFSCAFCGFPERAGDYRFLDVGNVEKMLNSIASLGTVTTLTFIDDTFNVPKTRFKEILRMMIRNNYVFKWNCFYRSDQGDDETIELMGQAGCEGVFLGVESGSDRMLERMNKTARRKHYARAIPLLRAAGISTYASLIIGFPGETSETVQETINFLEESAPDYYRAQLWYADPVTPVWKRREELGISGMGFNWKHHSMDVRRACDWIDRVFLEVQNSMWLPQFGFEQWSTFYLARKGMTQEQIKTFLHNFNACIKHRMMTRENDPPRELWSNLRFSSQFDRKENAKAHAAAEWSGNAYREAMRALGEEFKDVAGEEPHSGRSGAAEQRSHTVRIERSALPEGSITPEFFLAAYAALLDERESDGLMLFQPDTECPAMPLPLHAKPPSHATFSRWKHELAEKVKRLAPYRHFAAGICQSVLWKEQYGIGPLPFRHGLRWHSRTEQAAKQAGLQFSPAMDAEMHEIVDVYCYENNISLTLRAAAAPKNNLEERLEKFLAVLELAGSNPAIDMTSLSARQAVLDTAV
jgi:anaerobic magnesium-protoporphyrin IX monomethyl ester cyclase